MRIKNSVSLWGELLSALANRDRRETIIQQILLSTYYVLSTLLVSSRRKKKKKLIQALLGAEEANSK